MDGISTKDDVSSSGSFDNSSPYAVAIGLMTSVLVGSAVAAVALGDSLYGWKHPLWGWFTDEQIRVSALWTFTLLGIAMALLVLVRTSATLFNRRYECAMALLIAPATLTGVNIGPIDASDICFFGVFWLWLAFSLFERRPFGVNLTVMSLLAGLTTISILSIIAGRGATIVGLHTIISKIVLMVLVASLAADRKVFRFACKALIAVTLVSAVIAALSEVAYVFTGFALTFEDFEEFRFKDTPIGTMVRATALMSTAQGLGQLLLIGLSFTLSIEMKPILRFAAAAIIGAGIASTFSTGAYIVAVLVVLAGLLWRCQSRLPWFVFGAAVAFGLYLTGLGQLIYEELLIPLGGEGLNDRIDYARRGLVALQTHPWLGIGLNNFGRINFTPIHNAYLQITAETGVFGGLFFTALILYAGVGSALCAIRAADSEYSGWVRGVALSSVAVAVHLFLEPFYNNIMSWIIMGLAVACMPSCHGVMQSPDTRRGTF